MGCLLCLGALLALVFGGLWGLALYVIICAGIGAVSDLGR